MGAEQSPPTLRDVAAHAGVSPMTASAVDAIGNRRNELARIS
jgi:hypothetical protein